MTNRLLMQILFWLPLKAGIWYKVMAYVTRFQIQQARKANLAEYLLQKYPADVKSVGCSLCLKENSSLYIKKSFPGYQDFATGEHGNSLDFLVRYLHFSFVGAVLALCNFEGSLSKAASQGKSKFCLPRRANMPFERVTAYLSQRGIPREMTLFLIEKNLLYQDETYSNAVFVTPNEDYCEIRGTGNKEFHGCKKMKPDRFWYLLTVPNPQTVYICEAAIDAISLMLIHQAQSTVYSAAYVSIGGVSNQQTIDRIKRKKTAVLAVDNDPAGEQCRKRNPDLIAIIPHMKDWNDDLQSLSM